MPHPSALAHGGPESLASNITPRDALSLPACGSRLLGPRVGHACWARATHMMILQRVGPWVRHPRGGHHPGVRAPRVTTQRVCSHTTPRRNAPHHTTPAKGHSPLSLRFVRTLTTLTAMSIAVTMGGDDWHDYARTWLSASAASMVLLPSCSSVTCGPSSFQVHARRRDT